MVEDRGHLGEDLLGLDGFEVLACWEFADERVVLVETDAARGWCCDCGARAGSKGRASVQVRDLPAGGKDVRLVWRKRIWRCEHQACPVGSWRERHPAIRPRAVLTQRARVEAARQVGEDGRSVASVARQFGVSWDTVMRAVDEVAAQLFAAQHIWTTQTTPATAIGVDEKVMNRSTPDRRRRYVTVVVDPVRGVCLDVVEGRSRRALSGWLAAQSRSWRAGVAVATLDAYAPYRVALTDDDTGLPNAQLVIDHFHACKLGNQVIDDVRRRVQRQTTGHRGRKHDPLFGVRKLLLCARQRLDDHAEARIRAALAAGDPWCEVECAWMAKELLREIYAAANVRQAERRLDELVDWADEVQVPEVSRLARTVTRWRDEILAYHTCNGASNGPVEAVNGEVEQLERTARGFRNFTNFRTRILLQTAVRWHTRPTPRLRGPRAEDIPPAPSFIA